MNLLAEHPYYKVERQISEQGPTTVIHSRRLLLYTDRLETRHRNFPLSQVFDISFRPFGGEALMIYLHTHQGVYTYMTETDPKPFILAYKSLVSR